MYSADYLGGHYEQRHLCRKSLEYISDFRLARWCRKILGRTEIIWMTSFSPRRKNCLVKITALTRPTSEKKAPSPGSGEFFTQFVFLFPAVCRLSPFFRTCWSITVFYRLLSRCGKPSLSTFSRVVDYRPVVHFLPRIHVDYRRLSSLLQRRSLSPSLLQSGPRPVMVSGLSS